MLDINDLLQMIHDACTGMKAKEFIVVSYDGDHKSGELLIDTLHKGDKQSWSLSSDGTIQELPVDELWGKVE